MSKLSLFCCSLSSLFLILLSVEMKNIYLLVLCSSLLEKHYHVLPRSPLPYTKQRPSSSLFSQTIVSRPLNCHPTLLSTPWLGTCLHWGTKVDPLFLWRGHHAWGSAAGRRWTISHFLLTQRLCSPHDDILPYSQQHHVVCPSHARELSYFCAQPFVQSCCPASQLPPPNPT